MERREQRSEMTPGPEKTPDKALGPASPVKSIKSIKSLVSRPRFVCGICRQSPAGVDQCVGTDSGPKNNQNKIACARHVEDVVSRVYDGPTLHAGNDRLSHTNIKMLEFMLFSPLFLSRSRTKGSQARRQKTTRLVYV